MDKLTTYAQLLHTILAEHEAFGRVDSTGMVTTHFVYDDTNAEYLIINIGWNVRTQERIYAIVFHGWIEDGKIWVEWDNISPSVVGELTERGVPEGDIISASEVPLPKPKDERVPVNV